MPRNASISELTQLLDHIGRQEFSTLSHSISQYAPLTPDIHPQGTPRYRCDDEVALGQGLVALSLSDPDSSDMSDGSDDPDNMSDMSDMSDRDTTSASMVDGVRVRKRAACMASVVYAHTLWASRPR